MEHHNKTRQPIKDYEIGDIVYVRQNKRKGSKLTSRYKQEIVRENNHTTIVTNSGKVVHKSKIKN